MAKRILFLWLILVSAFSVDAQTYTNITAVDLHKHLGSKKVIILDIRTEQEYNAGHIAGAVLYSPQDNLFQKKLLSLPKNKQIYLYCYSGARSRSAAEILVKNGYTKVFNMQRGLLDWNAQKYPLVTPTNTATPQQEHAYSVSTHASLITKQKLVLVDYYAPWCAPCRQMSPMVEELKKAYENTVAVEKVNIDASKELQVALGIRNIPLFILYKDGVPVFTYQGVISKADLEAEIKKHVQ